VKTDFHNTLKSVIRWLTVAIERKFGGDYLAIVWRGFKEDQVLGRRSLEAAICGNKRRALTVEFDQRRCVIALLETVPSLRNGRKLVPAGANVARTGNAVALASRLRVLEHRLYRHKRKGITLNLYSATSGSCSCSGAVVSQTERAYTAYRP